MPTLPRPLRGTITVPADKSIAHRAIMFSSLAKGKSIVRATVFGRDNFATVRVMNQLGVKISGSLPQTQYELAANERLQGLFTVSSASTGELIIESYGVAAFKKPKEPLYCGNSGTTARLLTGVLAGCSFAAELTGDDSLSRRPFRRVTEPLAQMGATFSGEKLPLQVSGGRLKGIRYESPRASAQIKSAVLLAGLQAEGPTTVIEPSLSRDHTERMLSGMGIHIASKKLDDGHWEVSLSEGQQINNLQPATIDVPGDFSAAAFFIVAALLVPDSSVTINNVGLNNTRLGLLAVLKKMGAQITISNKRVACGEDIGDVSVRASTLRGVEVTAEDVVLAIDEIPILSIAAAFANGTTVIHGAEELRVKESDRLAMIGKMLTSYGCAVKEFPDGLEIAGNPKIASNSAAPRNREWRHSLDHRIEMSAAVLDYALTGKFEIGDKEAVETSFPTFLECFRTLVQ